MLWFWKIFNLYARLLGGAFLVAGIISIIFRLLIILEFIEPQVLESGEVAGLGIHLIAILFSLFLSYLGYLMAFKAKGFYPFGR